MQNENILLREEAAALRLRALYAEGGYRQYKMSKFEEYDLYANNKDFLESDRIITFTDVSGKLMALKPDVTLSIVRHTDFMPGRTEKLYYNETVYRVPKGAPGFREMPQVGLECIGDTGGEDVAGVIGLALGSLEVLADEYVLDLSHFGLVSAVLEEAGLSGKAAKAALQCLHEKNAHGLAALCEENGVPADAAGKLQALVQCYGAPETALPALKETFGAYPACAELESLCDSLTEAQKKAVRIDFSVQGNLKYYNGIVFKGYVKGLPAYVLSGGQYDGLLKRMKKPGRALGFAVYLDSLRLLPREEECAWKC